MGNAGLIELPNELNDFYKCTLMTCRDVWQEVCFVLRLQEPCPPHYKRSIRAEPCWTFNMSCTYRQEVLLDFRTENEKFTFYIIGINTPISSRSIQINKRFLANNQQRRSLSIKSTSSHKSHKQDTKLESDGNIYIYIYIHFSQHTRTQSPNRQKERC